MLKLVVILSSDMVKSVVFLSSDMVKLVVFLSSDVVKSVVFLSSNVVKSAVSSDVVESVVFLSSRQKKARRHVADSKLGVSLTLVWSCWIKVQSCCQSRTCLRQFTLSLHQFGFCLVNNNVCFGLSCVSLLGRCEQHSCKRCLVVSLFHLFCLHACSLFI